jgi:hypothetical protein
VRQIYLFGGTCTSDCDTMLAPGLLYLLVYVRAGVQIICMQGRRRLLPVDLQAFRRLRVRTHHLRQLH